MKYHKWTYQDDAVIVQKLVGNFSVEFIIGSDEYLIPDDGKHDTYYLISDISEARFEKITIEEVKDLVANFIYNLPKQKNVFFVLLIGNDLFEFVDLATEYVRGLNSELVKGEIFTSLGEAMKWLNLDPKTQDSIRSELKTNAKIS